MKPLSLLTYFAVYHYLLHSMIGRKRGRPAAKSLTAAPEAGEQLSVEVVEETPAPKSRRGRKGKIAQAETVSVSETPPSKVHVSLVYSKTLSGQNLSLSPVLLRGAAG